jgi:hypothetical protein
MPRIDVLRSLKNADVGASQLGEPHAGDLGGGIDAHSDSGVWPIIKTGASFWADALASIASALGNRLTDRQ